MNPFQYLRYLFEKLPNLDSHMTRIPWISFSPSLFLYSHRVNN
ncbi:transposase IS66 [Moorella thermoacetica Y72]|uniref:Transposase IS66 n=1 Tax=Moorella thermoacetica Y72 TaxID=1325331 RepID=A0A0S6U837_NEOTH|nr:transposase IS66 [Moorella thermoacetica Y72]